MTVDLVETLAVQAPLALMVYVALSARIARLERHVDALAAAIDRSTSDRPPPAADITEGDA